MARNKYPEKTIDKILSIAEDLFVSKGYSNTTMQDIIDGLSSEMTKGAIYHHFKSKEDIYACIVNQRFESIAAIFREVEERSDLTGAEKITVANSLGVMSAEQDKLVNFVAQVQTDTEEIDSTVAAFIIRVAEDKFIPIYHKFTEEGVADGSIKFEHADVVAEALVYVLFVWLSCRLTALDADAFRKRMSFVEGMFKPYEIKLITDEARDVYDKMLSNKINK